LLLSAAMRNSVRCAPIRKALIKFPKRVATHGPDAPKPHPCAPIEIKKTAFQGMVDYRGATTHPSPSSGSAGHPWLSFWDAPSRFTQSAPLKQDEMEAIESGGASLHT